MARLLKNMMLGSEIGTHETQISPTKGAEYGCDTQLSFSDMRLLTYVAKTVPCFASSIPTAA